MFASEFNSLVRKCMDGHQPAIAELIHQYRGMVFGLCMKILGQREDAEDATQETFVRVIRNLHQWDATRKFEPWLLAIAGNRCRTSLAKRKRRPTPAPLDFPLEDCRERENSAKNLKEEMGLALSKVREDHRTAFLLFHEHEKSYEEISASLNVPLGTVKTWVHRARKEMIMQLKKRGALENISR